MEDDRIRTRDMEKFVATVCGSEFEGCFCARPKAHEGLHRCGSALNRCELWTDEEANRWWAEFDATR